MSTFIALFYIIWSLLFGWTRLQLVEKMVDIYQLSTGVAFMSPRTCEFDDVDTDAPCIAYDLGITAGTSEHTFEPDKKLEPYMAFMFVAKTMTAIEEYNGDW